MKEALFNLYVMYFINGWHGIELPEGVTDPLFEIQTAYENRLKPDEENKIKSFLIPLIIQSNKKMI